MYIVISLRPAKGRGERKPDRKGGFFVIKRGSLIRC
jgi:hypothetical protein